MTYHDVIAASTRFSLYTYLIAIKLYSLSRTPILLQEELKIMPSKNLFITGVGDWRLRTLRCIRQANSCCMAHKFLCTRSFFEGGKLTNYRRPCNGTCSIETSSCDFLVYYSKLSCLTLILLDERPGHKP
jgi:hypothetical protein